MLIFFLNDVKYTQLSQEGWLYSNISFDTEKFGPYVFKQFGFWD
jgi:hypothetical protein